TRPFGGATASRSPSPTARCDRRSWTLAAERESIASPRPPPPWQARGSWPRQERSTAGGAWCAVSRATAVRAGGPSEAGSRHPRESPPRPRRCGAPWRASLGSLRLRVLPRVGANAGGPQRGLVEIAPPEALDRHVAEVRLARSVDDQVREHPAHRGRDGQPAHVARRGNVEPPEAGDGTHDVLAVRRDGRQATAMLAKPRARQRWEVRGDLTGEPPQHVHVKWQVANLEPFRLLPHVDLERMVLVTSEHQPALLWPRVHTRLVDADDGVMWLDPRDRLGDEQLVPRRDH